MDLTNIILKSIAEAPRDAPRHYIGASSIGKQCARAIWYGFVGADATPIPPGLKTTFDIGKQLEGLLLDYIESSGIKLTRPSEENEFLLLRDPDIGLFQGHADALIEVPGEGTAILEIKTAKASSFQRFKTRGLRIWQDVYYAQLQSYMGMAALEKAVLLAINKDSSELHHEWVEFDEIFYTELRMKAGAISTCEEPPERINRNPIYQVCNICPYKVVCHN